MARSTASQVERRADARLTSPSASSSLTERGQLARARLHLVEQAHVLDRDHGLVGELLQQLFLCLRHGSEPRAQPTTMTPSGSPWRSIGTPSMSAPAHGRGKPLIVVRIGQRVLARRTTDPARGRLVRIPGTSRAASGTWPEAAPHNPGPRCGWRRNGAARHRSGTRSQTGFRRERRQLRTIVSNTGCTRWSSVLITRRIAELPSAAPAPRSARACAPAPRRTGARSRSR